MSQDNTKDVPNEDESLTNGTKDGIIETEKCNLTMALEKRELVAKFPLPNDSRNLTSEVYNIIQLIYDKDDIPLKNWFSCSVCSELMYVVRTNGIAKLRRHKCFIKWKEQKKSNKCEKSFDDETLANLLARIANVGITQTVITSKHIRPILPEKSSHEEW